MFACCLSLADVGNEVRGDLSAEDHITRTEIKCWNHVYMLELMFTISEKWLHIYTRNKSTLNAKKSHLFCTMQHAILKPTGHWHLIIAILYTAHINRYSHQRYSPQRQGPCLKPTRIQVHMGSGSCYTCNYSMLVKYQELV